MSNINTKHYDETVDIFSTYRIAKNIMKSPIVEEQIKRGYFDDEEMAKDVKRAQDIVCLVDKAVLKINTVKDGDRLSKILFYRYMNPTPLSEEEIMLRLSYENTAKTRATYYRLRNKALCIASNLIWEEDTKLRTIQTVNIPKRETRYENN